MYRIRAFGDDRTCSSITELQEALATHYRARSVSVMYHVAPYGLRRCLFVDVLPDGSIRESYGEQRLVDFQELEAEAVAGASSR